MKQTNEKKTLNTRDFKGLLVCAMLVAVLVTPSDAFAEAKKSNKSISTNHLCICNPFRAVEGRLNNVWGDVLVSGATGFLNGKIVRRVRVGAEIITGSHARGILKFGKKCRVSLGANETIRVARSDRGKICIRRKRLNKGRAAGNKPPHVSERFGRLFLASLTGVLHYLHHKHHNNPVSR